jgi:hypothetical protein
MIFGPRRGIGTGLLACLPALLLMSCTASRIRPGVHPAPTEVVGSSESEADLQRRREIWDEIRHRTPPGVSWREVEVENRRRNLAMRSALFAGAEALAPVPHWRERGSFDQTGRTHVTAVGTDGETLFIGSDGGGVFSGSPGGNRWRPRSDSLGIGVLSFVIVPGTPEVWIAAGYSAPLYISTNQGLTWSQPTGGPGAGAQVARLLRDPGQTRTVHALAWVWSWNGSEWLQDAELYTSKDGGLKFNRVSTQKNTGTPDIWIDRLHGGPLYLGTRQGVKKSTNGGTTFTPVWTLPFAAENLVLAGSEAGAPTLYAAVRRSSTSGWQLFLSEDGGTTWVAGSMLPDFWQTLTASLTDPALVFVGGTNAYRSINAGRSFDKINDWTEYYGAPDTKMHADLPGIDCVLYHGHEVVFFNTDGGTFLSEDGGRTVRNITRFGLGTGQYYGILTSVHDGNLVAAGAQDQGYQISRPSSGSLMGFDQVISGDYGSLSSSDGTHNMLYSAYPGFILLQKREAVGATQQELELFDFPVPAGERRHWWIPELLADPDDSDVVYYADRRVWRMERQGPSNYSAQALPNDFGPGQDRDYVTALAISPANRNRWFTGTVNGKLWYSQDGGNTWTLGQGIQYFYAADLLPDPTNPDICYVSGSGYDNDSVYRTTDGGKTWKPMSAGLPPTLTSALAFDDPVRLNLYAATEAGPFRYDKPSGKWISLLGTEAPLTHYTDVEGIPQEGIVRFSTYGRGIWDYSPTGGQCIADDTTFCFQNGRFEVKVAWKDFSGNVGDGHVVPGSGSESGLFWFFQSANWEMMVKVLDACSANNRFWVFSAATTTVEYTLRVRDTLTGRTVEYKNPSGKASPAVTDTGSFLCSATASVAQADSPFVAAPILGSPASASLACETTATTLCLSGRFRVEMDWRDFQSRTGQGQVADLRSSESGIFWFFSPKNWETLTKVVDGCSLNGHYWFFGAALTTVEYSLKVTDTVTGEHREYSNPLGRSSPTIADTSALPCK